MLRRFVERRAAGSWFSLALLNGLTLLTVGIASHHSFLQVLETDRQKQQTQEALVNLQTLLTQMAELEVGRRGYFLTNENSQLTSYQAAIANVERTLPELKPVLSGSTQKQRFNQLSQLIDQQVKSLTTSIQTHRQTPQSSSKIGPVTHGKAHNTIRTLIIDMKGHEQKALLDATAAFQTNIKTSLTLLVGGLGLSLAMSAVIFWLLNQQLVRRRLAEQDLKQANQLLRILSTCNQHLVHAREEHSFLQQVCQDVVQLGNYSLAWVSLLTTPDTLQPIASAGQPLETLAPLQPLEPMDDRSPTARAIATGQLSLEQDIDRSNSSTTWRREALAQRHRAMLALPLISDGKCLGALTIATPTTNTFSTSQITLMADLAADLAYGIKTLRTQQARQQVEAQLQQSEQRLQSILQHMPVLLNALDEQWNYIAWNQECERVTGYSAAEIIGNPNALKLLYPNPDYLRKMMAEWEVRGHNYRNWEWEFTHKNGEVHIISWSNISDTCPIPGWPVWGIGVDVTDQKKAEAQLRDSEQRLGLAIEGAGMATWDHDLRTGRSIWSPQHFWLMGYPYQSGIEGRAEDWFRQVHPQDLERIAEAKLKARQERSLYTCEYRIHRADTGEIAWFADFGRFIYDENGEATRLVGVVFDITQRKQAELALQQLNAELEQRITERTADLEQINHLLQQELHRRQWTELLLHKQMLEVYDLYNQAPCGYHSLDEDGMFIRINQTELNWLGYTQDEIVGKKNFMDLLTSSSRQVFLENFPRFKQTGWVHDLQFSMVCKDGSILPVSISATAITDEAGNFVMTRSTMIDIRARKQAEEALRESEERFRSAFENAAIGMMIIAVDGTFLKVNSRFCELIGYSESELLGTHFQCITYPEDLSDCLVGMQWLSKGEMSVYEAQKRYVHRQGRIIWVFVTMSLVRDGQQRPLYYVAQAQDITERRAIEQKKHELVAIVSHKLRTPLTTIQASMNALASGVIAAEPDRAQQILEMAAIDTERLLHLVGAILDLEELESGRVPLRRIWCNAADLVQQAVQAVASLVDSAGISVEVSADPLRLWVDADRIQQALTHLLDNAIRSSAHGSTVWITAKTYERSTKVLRPSVSFTVRDQGRGIPANKLDTIFDRFQQVDTADDHKTNSTGLGLTICRAIAKQHGGQIWVESDLGRGSTFFLTVPMPMTSAG